MTPHMYDIIRTKRDGGRLDDGTIHSVIAAYVTDRIPDYQMAALLMAIWFRGLDDAELAALTRALIDSGERIDLSSIPGTTVDKHSTGGVGDKTTLVVAPVVAACGVPVAKLSGRGLGHTGGTIDKLEAIPGFSCDLSGTAFLRQVETIGIAVAGQTADIAPGDKKLYALRDVTATVDSLPLIAASIMSKKLAAGSDAIQLDVKTGSGAFMKSLDDAIRLAETMVAIGTRAGRPTRLSSPTWTPPRPRHRQQPRSRRGHPLPPRRGSPISRRSRWNSPPACSSSPATESTVPVSPKRTRPSVTAAPSRNWAISSWLRAAIRPWSTIPGCSPPPRPATRSRPAAAVISPAWTPRASARPRSSSEPGGGASATGSSPAPASACC